MKYLNRLPPNYDYPLAAFLGALMPLAFAPFGFWPLAILLPTAILLLADRGQSPRQVFYLGWCFGLGYFGFGVYWIYNSLHDFGMASPLVAGGITALLIAVMALFPALTLASWKHAERRFGGRALWSLPLLWFAFEVLRGWFLTGLPWISLGYAHNASPLAGYAPIIGVYGIGALCLLMAIALIRILRDRCYPYLVLLLAIPACGWLLQQLEWSEPLDNSLKVTIVQGNIPQELKWQFDQRQNIFNTYWRETSNNWDSDLIVWPETALPGQSENLEVPVLEPLANAAIAQDSHILTGIVVSDTANNLFYNSLMLLGEDPGVYHKRHLVLFGEYYPLRWLLDFMRTMINIPYSDLEPGPLDQPLLSVKGNKLGLSICFEDVFSRDILLALPAANILVNVSNDAWFGDSLAPHQHLQIAQMRALETARPLVRSTNTGVSAFIDYRGRILARAEQFKTLSLTQTVTGRTGTTPFYYFAMLQGPLAFLVLLGLLYSVIKQRTRIH